MSSPALIWMVAAASTAGVILRPFNLAEAIWAVAGAALLVALRLVSPEDALAGIGKGADVYLFLTGMMLLAETGRAAGVFDWLAAVATRRAEGSGRRLFLLVYCVGAIVTTFLSNDATAVVLTPAVAAAVKTARAKEPLPYLLVCAFIANAASFVLPLSNPANLVIYQSGMPPLFKWLSAYLVPSVFSIGVTYLVLRWTQRAAIRQTLATDVPVPALSAAGRMAAFGIAAAAAVLVGASVLGLGLGPPTAAAGAVTAVAVLIRERQKPSTILKRVSWSVLPLVAGLFVLVEAVGKTGLIAACAAWLHGEALRSASQATWIAGLAVALASNLLNNLPVGLVAGNVVQVGQVPDQVTRAVLIGVDLGPNLSVTGSLATLLWLMALRREGLQVSAGMFLRLGVFVMLPALLLADVAASMLPLQ